ncbi:hypothetical protein [Candidatus Protochlamydia amoebophila]|uniref:Uncharacterized protein n=1 Tax=Candidatus Protochlamydia amoebophila TaxID=362787 RepID=A0A0C1H0R4_9BACT|nr:hypothetical protein [Candidatus Protochlamydia amoebophila]KIC71349.1 hypothetical protein DB44_DV00030 [Candidatus Protochlamydia amoebophila]
MENIREKYTQLLSLTRLFLAREHKLNETLLSFPNSYAHFKPFLSHSLKNQQSIKNQTFASSNNAKLVPPPSSFSTDPYSKLPTSPDLRPSTPPLTIFSPNPQPTTTEPENPQRQKKESEILKQVEKTKFPPLLTLEPMVAVSPTIENQEFKEILKKIFPSYALSSTIPNDQFAKKLMNKWTYERQVPSIVILSFGNQESHLKLLKNIAKAISLRFAPSRVVSALKLEKEKQWNKLFEAKELCLVIASDYHLYLQPDLMSYYREEPKLGKHFLQQTPLLLLSDLDLYLKEPQLKSLLWRAICNELTPLTKISTTS